MSAGSLECVSRCQNCLLVLMDLFYSSRVLRDSEYGARVENVHSILYTPVTSVLCTPFFVYRNAWNDVLQFVICNLIHFSGE